MSASHPGVGVYEARQSAAPAVAFYNLQRWKSHEVRSERKCEALMMCVGQWGSSLPLTCPTQAQKGQ